MRSRTCVYLNVTLTYDVFSIVRQTVSEFSQYFLKNCSDFYQVSLLINPARSLWKKLCVSQPLFCSKCNLDCFSWPFGPSETICPKNLFQNTGKIEYLDEFSSNEVAPKRFHNSLNTNSLLFETVCSSVNA